MKLKTETDMARKAPFQERMARRLSIVTGRAKRSLPGSAPKHPSVFLHMPKCGGTSLSEAMYATVPFHERIGVIDAVSSRRAAAMLHFGKNEPFLCHEDLDTGQMVFNVREGMLLQHMAWNTMLIHGHVFWSEQAEQHFGQTYKYVTLLRDPVARTISNYRMSQRAGLTTADVDAYLAGNVAKRHARVYLRYLTGQNDIADDAMDDAITKAKERLTRFAIIGFLDQTDEFLRQYRTLFGVKLRLAQLNAAPDRPPDYTDDQMQRIRALCAPDIALYDFAKTIG
jgi:hypothetical protein